MQHGCSTMILPLLLLRAHTAFTIDEIISIIVLCPWAASILSGQLSLTNRGRARHYWCAWGIPVRYTEVYTE